MTDFITYTQKKSNGSTSYTFHPSESIDDIPGTINAVLAIVMLADSFITVQKASGEWDIMGGKCQENETPIETIHREVQEEAGVIVSTTSQLVVGYIECINDQAIGDHFDSVNYMPVYLLFVESVDRNWIAPKNEILNRRLVSHKKLTKLLATRTDGGQLEQIISYAKDYLVSKGPVYGFEFEASNHLDESKGPVTQVMAFCANSDDKYCIVRDGDEDFYSLPGGGCELEELPDQAIVREVKEEAQITPDNFMLLGSVIVTLSLNSVVVSSSQHLRYLSSIDHEPGTFIPGLDGFETVERLFVDKAELKQKVMLLNNKTGDDILACL